MSIFNLPKPTPQQLQAAIAYENKRPYGSSLRVAELEAQLEASLIASLPTKHNNVNGKEL